LEEPFTDNKTLPIMDLIAEEQLENPPETIKGPNDSYYALCTKIKEERM
jgi:hypothetical protein